LEKEKLVGIITDKDIFRSLGTNKELLSTILGGRTPIPEDKFKEEISHFFIIPLSIKKRIRYWL
jgi:CBS domain-containing protein